MLMKKPGSTQSEIVLFTNLTPATINWHMKRLIEENVVEIKREGRNIRYYIRDVDKVENLMRLYYPAFWERWADNFAELWSELSNFKKEEKKYD